jgi:hypothetical protein
MYPGRGLGAPALLNTPRCSNLAREGAPPKVVTEDSHRLSYSHWGRCCSRTNTRLGHRGWSTPRYLPRPRPECLRSLGRGCPSYIENSTRLSVLR